MQVFSSQLTKWPHRSAVIVLAIGFLFRLVIALLLPPGFDETYYFTYTLHPDWSYFDHPPLVALVTAIGPWLTGGQVTQFTIRIGTLLVYTGTLWWLYRAGVRLFSPQAGLLALIIATIVPIFQMVFGILVLPDVPLMFFWTAVLYWAAVEFFPPSESYQPTWRLALIGLLVGAACLGKYHGFALGAGLGAFCLFSPRHRSALVSPWLLLGAVLFVVALFPVLYWNWQHDWVSFRFQSGRAVPTEGYRLLDALGVFLVHVGYMFPTIGFALWWLIVRSVIDQVFPRSLSDQQLRLKQQLILWVSLPIALAFTLMGGYRQILPSWTMPGFYGCTLLLGYQASQWQQTAPKTVRRWLQGSALAVATLAVIGLLHVSFGLFQKPRIPSIFPIWDVHSDPSTQLFDVQQLRRGILQSPFREALQDSSFIFTNDFFVGGQLGMALAPATDRPITCFSADLRGFAFWSRPDQWLGKNALYITTERFQLKTGTAEYAPYFQSIALVGKIPMRRAGVATEVFLVYHAKTLLKPYPRPYGIS
ncbi:MAG: glycosyltransferase family 39 protein [Cyanobacteria bacterium]|nr:glycosyltransferase family 39 protein [Cyanobacteriota bacterium]